MPRVTKTKPSGSKKPRAPRRREREAPKGEYPLHSNRAEIQLFRQAIRQGWIMPEEVYDKVPQEMLDLVLSDTSHPREKIAAAAVLTKMHGQNQADDPPEQKLNLTNGGVQIYLPDNHRSDGSS